MSRRNKAQEDAPPDAAVTAAADVSQPVPAATSEASGPPSAVTPVPAPEPAPTPDALLAAQFKGSRAALRHVYDVLTHVVRRIDPKVRIHPEKSCVRLLRHKRTFAVVKTSPEPRIDLGLALGDIAPRGRLKRGRVGGVEGITHKVELFGPTSVDADVVLWVKKAWASGR